MSDLSLLSDLRELIKIIYKIQFPKEEAYGMQSQIRRACVSVSLNIREGNCFKDKKKLNFFRIAKGSLNEVDECMLIAKEIFISDDIFDDYRKQYWLCLNKLNKLIYSINSTNSKTQEIN